VNWAKDYYHHWDGMKGTCPVCGLNYVPDVEEDRRLHRNFHREVVTTFDPRPNAALKRRHATIGEDFLPVNWGDPKGLHRRLYLIARMLIHSCAYLLADNTGESRMNNAYLNVNFLFICDYIAGLSGDGCDYQ